MPESAVVTPPWLKSKLESVMLVELLLCFHGSWDFLIALEFACSVVISTELCRPGFMITRTSFSDQ